MTLPARVVGVIRRPHATFEAVLIEPKWLGLMAGMVVASAVASALLFRSEVGRLALIDQWERTAIAFGQQVDDARYEELQSFSERAVSYSVATAILAGPGLIFGVSSLLFVVLRSRFPQASFRQMLAVVTHASVILTLRQVVAAPIAYARETTSSPTTLGVWFPMFDESSPVARFLGALDLFMVWWVVVLAIGVSLIYRRSARPLAITFLGAYVAGAFVMAVAMSLLGRTV